MPAAKNRSRAVGVAAETALDVAAAFAAKSDKLTAGEKRELATLRKGTGWSKMTASERARYIYLIQKFLPKVPLPKPPGGDGPTPPSVSEPRDVDPLDRLAQLADLRERGAVDDAEFERLKQRILDTL